MKLNTAEQIITALKSIEGKLHRGELGPDLDAELTECFDAAHTLGDTTALVQCLRVSAGRHLLANQRDAALRETEAGLHLVRGSGRDDEADLLVLLARLRLANDVEGALQLLHEAMEISAANHGRPRPHVQLRHAEALGAAGRFKEAIAAIRSVDQTYEMINDVVGRSNALQRLCVQLINSGHYAAAIEYASEAIRVAADNPNPLVRINALKFLAIGLTKAGRLSEAFEVARKALDVCQSAPRSHLNADLEGVVGDIYLDLGDHATALRHFAQAYRQYRDGGFRNGEAIALSRMAETYARVGGDDQAQMLYAKARALAESVRHASILRNVIIGQAAIHVRMGRHDEAEALLRSVDSSLRTIETVTPSDATIRNAVETFRTITRAVGAESLPSYEALIDAPETPLAEGNPAPMPPPPSTRNVGIHVYLLGTFRVVRHGVEITMDEWKRKKARDIFKLLATNHRRPVSTDEIVLHIWGDDTPVDACLPTLQNAVSAIRTALEPGLRPRQPSAYLGFRDGSYTLDLGAEGSVDIEAFKGRIIRAYGTDDPADRRRLLAEATAMYGGDLLPDDRFEPWTDFLRDELRRMCADALDNLAAVCFALGDDAAAKDAMRRAALFDEV